MKWQEISARFRPEKGVLLTLVLSIALSAFYFGTLFRDPAHIYFSKEGDGFQIYYETLYHIRFDKQWWHQESTNYPYGESIFFTGAMPFINNVAKLIGPASGASGVWLINMMMLLSPAAGALFLYLIFRHLKINRLYAGFCANGIAFLSPQLVRMTGHYSLQWVFLIPAFIFLLLKFYDYPNLKKSWAIAFLVFLGATTHMYFLAFFLALGGMYWFILFITRDRGFGRFLFSLKHFSIQLLLPLALIETIMLLTDHMHDRTHFPWGYFEYHSSFDGIFYPFSMPYEPLAGKLFDHVFPGWEGIAYIGLAAIVGLVAVLLVQLYRLVKLRFRLLLSVTDNKPLNIFFWTSVALCWFAGGHPFIGGHEDLLLYLGPLKQFRAIGRFTWAFFYLANIIAVYRVYRIFQHVKIVRAALCFLVAALLFYDGYYYIRNFNGHFDNRIAALEDPSHTLPEDQWLKQVDVSHYQAILPLPFFVIGSENLTRQPDNHEIIFRSYIASLQTGLPIMSTTAARISLSQAGKLLGLVYDPLHPYAVLHDLKDKRPLLVLVVNDSLSDNEKNIVAHATLLTETPQFRLFSIDPAVLAKIPGEAYAAVKNKYDSTAKFSDAPFLVSDSGATVIYRSFDGDAGPSYKGKGGIINRIRTNTVIYDSAVPPGNYIGNFWMNNIHDDVYPRTIIEIAVTDSAGKCTMYDAGGLYSKIHALDGNWGLVEFPVHAASSHDHLKVTLWNTEMTNDVMLNVDEFLLRPVNVDVFRREGEIYFRNNRYYSPPK